MHALVLSGGQTKTMEKFCRIIPQSCRCLLDTAQVVCQTMSKVLQIKVKTQSRVSELTQTEVGTWLAQLKSAPVDGLANAELIGLVAKYFACRKADVSIKSGATSRTKRVCVDGLD
jgi:uncharacterized protein YggU (UPF0235/DUF167 family)